jgi:hypothetical protein
MKKIGILIVLISVFLAIAFSVFFVLPFLFVPKDQILNMSRCQDEDRAISEEIRGVLVEKFRDKESHMWEVIEYSSLSGKQRSLVLLNDRSGAYEYIVQGDSISKSKGSLQLTVKRNDQEIVFQLDFGCLRSTDTIRGPQNP